MAAHSYPQFSDGDVEIHLSNDPSDKYVLHSYVLALHSPWFKASLSERWNNSGADKTSLIGGTGSSLLGGSGTAGGKSRWVYELHFDKDNALGLLTKKSLTPTETEMLSKLPSVTPPATVSLHGKRLGCVKAHQDMLGTLYHLAPAFSHENFEKAKASILLLANAADIYGCQHVTKLHIESHLRLYRTEVLEICAIDPVSMLELAMAVKSEWIFMEAATNLIGRSKQYFEGAQPRLADLDIADLMNKKRMEFSSKSLACEFLMFRMQPTSMSEWASITAINYFRQLLSERLEEGQGSALGRGYGYLYHNICNTTAIAKASRKSKVLAYNASLTSNPDETIEELMPHVHGVFERAAQIIAPIRQDITRRQAKKSDPHRSLAFMGVADDELPWVKK